MKIVIALRPLRFEVLGLAAPAIPDLAAPAIPDNEMMAGLEQIQRHCMAHLA